MPATHVATRDIPLTDLTVYPGNARRGNDGEGDGGGPAGGEPDRNPDDVAYVQVHWLVTVPQRQVIHQALAAARERLGVATAADALEAITRAYLTTTSES